METLSELQKAFVAWALDERLNIEEAFCAELMVEGGLPINDGRPFPTNRDMAEEAARRKRRQVNPAHRAKLRREDVEEAARKIPLVASSLLSGYSDDRTLRDISGLRFFPHYTTVNLNQTELTDISPLAALPKLESLTIMDKEIEDLRPLGKCKALRTLSLYLYRAWPKFAGLEDLPLETVLLHFNLLSLANIPALPHVRTAKFSTEWTLPDATHLPAMPQVKVLDLEARTIERLDGIERYPQLCNLTVSGPIRDLRPLTALTHLTHLTIRGCYHRPEILGNLAPLCALPELRKLTLITAAPMDLFVLMDAPKLREVVTENSDSNARDAETLAASLHSWDEDFLAPAPRPLPPLRFAAVDGKIIDRDYHTIALFADGPSGWDGDLQMRESETRWFEQYVTGQINRLMKGAAWGKTMSYSGRVRGCHVDLWGMEAAGRLEEVVELLRRALAQCRYTGAVTLRIYSESYEPEPEREPETDEDILEEHRDYEAREAEAARLREKRQRYEQLRAEGAKIDPEEFAEEIEVERSEDEDESIFACFMSGCLESWGVVREDGFYVAAHMRDPMEQFMERDAETL